MKMVPDKQFFSIVSFQSIRNRKKELCVDKKVQNLFGDVFCPTCSAEKCVECSAKKTPFFYDCKNWKACCHILKVLFKDQKPTIILFGGDDTLCFARKTSRHYKKRKTFSFFEEIPPPITIKYTGTRAEKKKSFHLSHNRVDSLLLDAVNQKIILLLILYTFIVQ